VITDLLVHWPAVELVLPALDRISLIGRRGPNNGIRRNRGFLEVPTGPVVYIRLSTAAR
jgi:hypothetical protein